MCMTGSSMLIISSTPKYISSAHEKKYLKKSKNQSDQFYLDLTSNIKMTILSKNEASGCVITYKKFGNNQTTNHEDIQVLSFFKKLFYLMTLTSFDLLTLTTFLGLFY